MTFYQICIILFLVGTIYLCYIILSDFFAANQIERFNDHYKNILKEYGFILKRITSYDDTPFENRYMIRNNHNIRVKLSPRKTLRILKKFKKTGFLDKEKLLRRTKWPSNRLP